MEATLGLQFKLDGIGDTFEISEIRPQKILDITSPKMVHVVYKTGSQKGQKAQGSPVLVKEATNMINNGFWVTQ